MQGLTAEQVAKSRAAYGENCLTQKKQRGFFRRFVGNLGDPVIRILLCALAVNVIFLFREGDWLETVGIGVSVFLATFISTLSEYRSETAFARLRAEEGGRVCRVRRAEGLMELPARALVVGDIVCVGAGEGIAADGRLISGRLGVDQSAMTGESREVDKHSGTVDPGCYGVPSDPGDPSALLAGTVVLSGSGEFVVTAVGDATRLGGISGEVQTETRPSPLKRRLHRLASTISRLGYAAAVIVALAYLINTFFIDSAFHPAVMMMKLTDWPYLASHLLHAFTLALTVIVVAVPEGLPMMIAVVLSANIRRMVRDHVLVRKPVGIEAAGSMNLLFTDKTGTLTEGKMSVFEILTPTECYRRLPPGAIGERIALQAACNCEAVRGASGILGGNATERAMVGVVDRGRWMRGVSPVGRLPFSSARKCSAAVIFRNGRKITLIKGAPDRLLPHIEGVLGDDGKILPFDIADLSKKMRTRASAGARLLLLAEAEGDCLARIRRGDYPCMVLHAVLVLRDRLRAEARGAVRDLQGAGIGVVMITGDSPETGGAIARDCGIIGGERSLILDGRELARMSDAEVAACLPKLAVVARAMPRDKSRLVRIAQAEELVVGMTGDGVNDSPALKLADIGFSLGSGTQVAREAGDIIILDDNLASVVRAVLYGRNIFKSIRKFITLQLTMNFSAVGVSMICPFLGIDAPVTVVQMLWINLIMDTLGGLAFAGEVPLPSLMHECPKKRDEPILCRYMVNQICWLGGFTIVLSLLFLKLPSITASFRAAQDNIYLLTAFFAFFIFAGVLNCFNSRTDRLNLFAGLGGNRAFLLIMTVVGVVQIIFVYLGGTLLRTAPLTPRELIVCLGMAALVIPVDFLRKLLWRAGHGKQGF